ncbi:MAG TPA: glycosyltransferase family 4 protein [Pirellulaceae bacterium]|nr:glycosyltransferase family 4 protein [Pirellulaceae bacterium]
MRLLVSEIFPPRVGGSGRWLYEVYRRLPTQSVTVAADQHAHAATFDAVEPLPIHRLPLRFRNWGMFDPRGWRGYWQAYRALAADIKQLRPTELHCGRCLPEGWLGLLCKVRFGLPFVCYVHGEELPLAAQSRELRWMNRQVLKHARLLIANTHNTARILTDNWQVPAQRVRVLHPGVDCERFIPHDASESVRSSLGWSGRQVLLTVGRLQTRKGHDTLIRALPKIREAVSNILYVIVGDGEERARLEALVDQLNVRSLVQFRNEPADEELIRCYQQCDLFVLPNREVHGDFEGFGMVLIEAQACGKPVIAGASGGTSEAVRHGRTGLVIPCEAPEPLAATIVALLADPQKMAAMGADARAWTERHFHWPSLVRSAAEILGLSPATNDVQRIPLTIG